MIDFSTVEEFYIGNNEVVGVSLNGTQVWQKKSNLNVYGWSGGYDPMGEPDYDCNVEVDIDGSTQQVTEGNYKVNNGTQVSITALSKQGYVFDHWVLQGDFDPNDMPDTTTSTVTFTVDGNGLSYSVSAMYRELPQFKVTNPNNSSLDLYIGYWRNDLSSGQNVIYVNNSVLQNNNTVKLEYSSDKTNWTTVNSNITYTTSGNNRTYTNLKIATIPAGGSLYIRNYDPTSLYLEHKNNSNIYVYTFPKIYSSSKFNVSGTFSTLFADQSASNRIAFGNKLNDCSGLVLNKTYASWHNSNDTRYDNTYEGCFSSMFEYCSLITTPPQITYSRDTTRYGQYQYMFRNCSALTTAPEFPESTITKKALISTFMNCTALGRITVHFTQWTDYKTYSSSSQFNTSSWTYNVKSTGTFTKPSALASTPRDVNHIPSGWTIVDV